MRTECSRNCWIAGGIAGLLVWLSIGMMGSAGWMAGLALGLLAGWMIGGILVWGLCHGAGDRADNDALLAGGWRDEPFNPIRRVVSAGGEVVSQEPLAMAERIPGGAPLESRTVTPRDEDAARPRIVAGAGPDAPVKTPARGAEGAPQGSGAAAADTPPATAEPARATDAASDAASADLGDPALVQPAAGVNAQVAHPAAAPVEGMVMEEPEVRDSASEAVALHSTGFVEPQTDAEAGADPRAPEGGIEPIAPSDAGASNVGAAAARPGEGDAGGGDDLTRIRGVGPMQQTWLAGYGVTRFAQIAEWDEADIARYSGMMGRMGHRIREEDWVGQARQLAAGGETAHSHAVDTGEAG